MIAEGQRLKHLTLAFKDAITNDLVYKKTLKMHN